MGKSISARFVSLLNEGHSQYQFGRRQQAEPDGHTERVIACPQAGTYVIWSHALVRSASVGIRY
jgi:hypothetical protein